MAIHQPAYALWSGRPLGRLYRVLAIATSNARIAFSNLWTLIFLGICYLGVGAMLFLFFILTILPRNVPADRLLPQYSSNNVYLSYLTDPFPVLVFALLGAAAGAGMLSRDLRSNAVSLYLSRPITKLDYLAGKALALVLFLCAGTLVPGLLLWLSAWMVGVEEIGWGSRLLDLLGIAATSLLVVVPLTACVLAFSSLTRKTALAGIYWILFFLGTWTVSETLREATRETSFGLLSIPRTMQAAAAALFETRVRMPPADAGQAALESALILGALTAAAAAVLWARLRRFEEI
jgi:ABC-type transport system involved in multi-copper enzyme maturation permease subunit